MHTYYDKHFFEFMPQGAPNFSWRIKKSDHQRNSISDGSSDDQGYRNSLGDDGKRRLKPMQPRRLMRPFFKPRSLKTTGSCHWILCSTRRKCTRIVGTNTFPKLSYRQGLKSVKVAGLELKTTSATTFDELVAKALPLVKLDSTIKTVEKYSSGSAPPLTFSTLPEADDDPDDKANASKTQWDIYRNSHYKQIFLNHFSVMNYFHN